MRALATIAAVAALGACSSFENPEIVIDFRILGIKADPPEQLVEVDIQNPAPPVELLEQVGPTDVCVLLSDRNFERRLRFELSICALDNSSRCASGSPVHVFGSGLWDDPEASPAPRLCDSIASDGNLLGVALHAYENDQLRGLGGIYYGVQLRVGGEGADPELDLFASKNMRLMPKIPAEIQANNNPTLAALELIPEGAIDAVPLPFGRCSDQMAPVEVPAGSRPRITPVEPEGVREDYVVPTLDGNIRMFTESLTYQFLATAGNYSPGESGGGRDPFGNPATLFTDWRAPAAEDLEGPTDVDLWVIQRDERLGQQWYESCIRVVP